MRKFVWCPEIALRKCTGFFPFPHRHIVIRSPKAQIKYPVCGADSWYLEFHDLDPEVIRKNKIHKDDPAKDLDLIAHCFSEHQARTLALFVAKDEKLPIVVNCEAGVSRSPGLVLALRRYYGGDTEEVFLKAVPNIHVTSLMSRALRDLGPLPVLPPKKDCACLGHEHDLGSATCACCYPPRPPARQIISVFTGEEAPKKEAPDGFHLCSECGNDFSCKADDSSNCEALEAEDDILCPDCFYLIHGPCA